MSLFLKIVVACLVAIGIAVVLAAIAGFVFFRKLCSGAFDEDPTPFTIHLHEDLHPDWVGNEEARQLIEQFHAAGFVSDKAYVIEELEKVRLLSFFSERYTAVVYKIEGMGYYYDMVHFGEDKCVTVSTTPFAGDLEMPPGKVLLGYDKLSIAEGLKILEEKTEGLASKELNEKNFRELFEFYYKEEQAFRNGKGGVSFEEFKRIAASQNFSEDKLREAFLESKTDELVRWNYASTDAYFDNREDDDEEGFDGHYFLVPERAYPKALIHYLEQNSIITEAQVEQYAEAANDDTNVVDLFDKINQSRSPELRAEKMAVVKFPVPGYLYKVPCNDFF